MKHVWRRKIEALVRSGGGVDGGTRARPYGRRLALTYGAFLAAAIVGVAVVEIWPDEPRVARYGPNLVTELVGILVTLIVVERLLAWQRTRATAPVRRVALRQMWKNLNSLTHMLLFAYKASAPPGSPQVTDFEALLSAWEREARWLDFRRPYGPDLPRRSWHVYAGEVATGFEQGVRDILDRYLDVLGSELSAAAEDLIDEPMFAFLTFGSAIERADQEYGIDQPRLSFMVQSVEDPEHDSLRNFALLLRRLHDAFERLGGPQLTLDARLYEDHLSPMWGSARWDGHTPS